MAFRKKDCTSGSAWLLEYEMLALDRFALGLKTGSDRVVNERQYDYPKLCPAGSSAFFSAQDVIDGRRTYQRKIVNHVIVI